MNKFATIGSQLGAEICDVEDTEEVFWLKMSDDYQSKVKAGDLLVGQYRFKDAIKEYEKALSIKNNDPMLYIKLGGAYLTLFEFEKAERNYSKAISCGVSEGVVSFYFGIMDFFKKDYMSSMKNFEKTNVDSGEMLISVIYWHTIASFKSNSESTLLPKYSKDLDVGHHSAYKIAASVFAQEVDYKDINIPESPLDAVIILCGLCEYLKHKNKAEEAGVYAKQALAHSEIWPAIAYLAIYNDQAKSKLM